MRNTVVKLDWLKKKVNNKSYVTSFKPTKYDFVAVYLDTSVLLFLLTKMQT